MPLSRSIEWVGEKSRGLLSSLGLVFALVVIGTAGYCVIERWSVLDSFYMTVISLSTVGYGEVHPLSQAGQLFTACLLIAGVGIAFYTWAAISQIVIEGELSDYRKLRKMQDKIKNLRNHFIVCGYGRLSKIVVDELHHSGQSVVIIESDPAKAEQLAEANHFYVEGSAYDDETLSAAGIERAHTLLSLLPKDADNVYVTLTARDLNPKLKIIARSEAQSGEVRLRRAGANQILSPYRAGGTRIVRQLLRPGVSEFLDMAGKVGNSSLVVEEVRVPLESKLSGRTLGDTNIRAQTGAIIAAFIDSKGNMVFNPDSASVIEGGSTLIILGQQNSVDKLNELL